MSDNTGHILHWILDLEAIHLLNEISRRNTVSSITDAVNYKDPFILRTQKKANIKDQTAEQLVAFLQSKEKVEMHYLKIWAVKEGFS